MHLFVALIYCIHYLLYIIHYLLFTTRGSSRPPASIAGQPYGYSHIGPGSACAYVPVPVCRLPVACCLCAYVVYVSSVRGAIAIASALVPLLFLCAANGASLRLRVLRECGRWVQYKAHPLHTSSK